MLELRHLCQRPLFSEDKRIIIARSPRHTINLQYTLNTRLLIFEKSSSRLSIDFVEQYVQPNVLYIVPASHIHHCSYDDNGGVICIDVDNMLLKDDYKELLYSIKYNPQKGFTVTNSAGNNLYQEGLALSQGEYNEQQVMVSIGRWIESNIPGEWQAKRKSGNYSHLNTADRLLALLSQKELTVESCKISNLASEIYCGARTLHRICTSIFGVCAKDIGHYHLTVKAIFLLTNAHLSIIEVADRLEFSSVTSFNHFIKRFTGHAPSQIRALHRSITIPSVMIV